MKLWHLSLLLLWPLQLAAQPATTSTKPLPVSIEADQLELDQGKGISHYRGNVVLTRGGLRIEAERITLYTREKKLQRAHAEGGPVNLTQEATAETGELHAEAASMDYLPQNELIKLKGNAHLWHDGNKFSGEQIQYNLKQQVVKASGDKQGDGRVKVILQPETSEQDGEKQP